MYRWAQVMRALRARERIEAHQDIQAALNPIHHQQFRLNLGEQAYDPESEEYAWYVSGIAGEKPINFQE